MNTLIKSLKSLILLLAISIFLPYSLYAQERKPVSIEEGSPLPLRVLTRPHAVLYSDEAGANPIEGQLPVFQSYFVYTRPGGEARAAGLGFYEVGTDEKGKIAGFIKSSDVFEWKQTMCLAYSHPEGRNPVLMFEFDDELNNLLKETPTTREAKVKELYSQINNAATTPLPKEFPVISVEPKLAVDISKQFYLLPILEHETIQMESYEGRKLMLAAVNGDADAKRDNASDIRTNTEYAAGATATEESHEAQKANAKYDVVFVMDTTRSMQPYIEEIRNTLQKMSFDLSSKKEVGSRIAFGIWAYRDPTEIKDIGYLTHNFTPELKPIDDFLTTLKDVKETTTDSVDVNEDVFAGVHDAITKTAWRKDSLRIIVLIGDAPAHELGHKWNTTSLDEKTIRTLASENKVTIISMHINPKINRRYNRLANRQFKALALNPGAEKELIWSMPSSDKAKFVEKSKELTDQIALYLEATLKNTSVDEVALKQEEKTAPAPEAKDTSSPSKEEIQQALKAATVTWLGSAAEVEPPSDIEAWVTDKDLLDPSIQALDVRLLVSKRQLDSLAGVLNDLIIAGTDSQMTSDDFFTTLQSVSSVASRNADQLAQAKTLKDSGLVPSFLDGLPYESQIMTMSSELWESLGPDEQDQFIESLRSKIAAYQSLHETPDQWVALNKGDAPDDFVTPIPLDLLP